MLTKNNLLNCVQLPENDCPTFSVLHGTKLASEPCGLHVRAGVGRSGKQRSQVFIFLFFTSTAALSSPGRPTPRPPWRWYEEEEEVVLLYVDQSPDTPVAKATGGALRASRGEGGGDVTL